MDDFGYHNHIPEQCHRPEMFGFGTQIAGYMGLARTSNAMFAAVGIFMVLGIIALWIFVPVLGSIGLKKGPPAETKMEEPVVIPGSQRIIYPERRVWPGYNEQR